MKLIKNKWVFTALFFSAVCSSFIGGCTKGEYNYTELLPPGLSSPRVNNINNNGDVVGYGDDGTGTYKGFIYSGGVYTELLPPGCIGAYYVLSINSHGDVVGSGDDGTGTYKGFIYSGGQYTELLPPGWTEAWAYSINNNGDVVGSGDDGTGTYKGFIAVPK